ncbi:ribonuclease T2 [Cryphonectria parasitica EP155]|uniref:ribonuclease T2 n=1 Tax=Cryphonectria parasitica (strain ATCC 38755 / EP155) TaxID=660469 RepID=A0A9P4Y5C3_CRYP1|nr:ribonuclease T2 [Cryphonectria parasitica EP155]KAF3766780.1 ribonuclease T2 [Cryphonectria parasitica EP155]
MHRPLIFLATLAATGEATASLYGRSLYGESTSNHTCQLYDPILSCSAGAQANITDSCCTETFGGLVLSTQYWDTYTGLESQGQVLPKNAWSLHGLWPDFCNGSYTQYCDLSRQYDPAPSPNTTTGTSSGTPVPPYNGSNIGTFLEPFGKYDLLAYMNKYWVSQGSPNYDFWGHEFSKHATCYSAFDVPCYGPQYVEHQDVVDFFETAIAWYRTVPTYKWLADAGIVPSNSTTYTLGDIQSVLTEAFGEIPYLACTGAQYNSTAAGAGSGDTGYTVLDEVWYYHHVYGRPQDVRGVPVAANATGGSLGNCASSPGAIHYYLRTNGSEA